MSCFVFFSFCLLFFFSSSSHAQPVNDNCSNAVLLCPNIQYTATNSGATAECGGADANCQIGTLWAFNITNSIWFKFVTNNVGGSATVSVSPTIGSVSVDAVLLFASSACTPSTYNVLDYEVSISTSFTLSSGALLPNTVYWVMVDSASGQSNFQIAVFGPAVQWDVDTLSTPTTCPQSCNGTATAAPISGISPYSYLWNTSPAQNTQTAIGLCNGNYTVTITDSIGCTANKTVAVDIAPADTLVFTFANTQCNCNFDTAVIGSGTASATLASGNQKTFLWSNGKTTSAISALCNGVYSVTITDSAGCVTDSSVTIGVISPPPTVSVEPTVECSSSCTATATATYSSVQTPFTYQWSTAPAQTTGTATGLCQGTDYTVTVTDKTKCKGTNQFTVPNPPPLPDLFVETTPEYCGSKGSAYAKVTGQENDTSLSYAWNNSNTSQFQTLLEEGTYSVTVTNANNCTKTAEGIVELIECEMKPSDKFSPNGDGTNDNWNITNASGFSNNFVVVYNRWGQRVYAAKGYNNNDVVWDGKYLGISVTDGAYFYIIFEDAENKKENVQHGSVMLLR